MKKTILTSIALAACVSTPLFAGTTVPNTKEDTLTFALTVQGQNSVSTTSGKNVGLWSQGPKFYKTASSKLTQTDIIKAIGAVLGKNYSSQAKLVLVQGELSGFFNITDDLANSTADIDGGLLGTFSTDDNDASTGLANSLDSTYVQLATGTHFETNPITGNRPVGHMQPWGQIFVKDSVSGACDNVTFFFNLTVEECYDCFFMNSFISDATFTTKTTTSKQSGPPCCTVPSSSQLFGAGTDRYYLTMGFDNSIQNPYLNSRNDLYVGFDGLNESLVDGVSPDNFGPYLDSISSARFQFVEKNKIRFTLNGIVTYKWNLKFVNTTDLFPDFVGTASYQANGHGFIGLVCSLLNGSASFTEKIVKETGCCLNEPWYGSEVTGSTWYGVGWDGYNGWYNDESPLNPQAALTYHPFPVTLPITVPSLF